MKELDPVRIVIVDDEIIVLDTVQDLIESIPGYTVVGRATDGSQAIPLVCHMKPDIVLMDIIMPNMDGITAAEEIQKICPTPVIILTGYDDPELINQARDAGTVAYLLKPLQSDLLPGIITMSIARFKDIMELRRTNLQLKMEIGERIQAEKKNQQLIDKLNLALQKISTLSGLLPICANCKKIKDDDGYWQEVEKYIKDHSSVDFSHGLCPACTKKLYPDIYEEIKNNVDEPD